MADRISITEVPARLRDHGISITYNKVWRAALEGRFPAHRDGARWFVMTGDLPLVADAFAPAGH